MLQSALQTLRLLPAAVTEESIRHLGQAPMSGPAAPSGGEDLWLATLKMIVALCFVIGLAAAAGWAVRRWLPSLNAAARGGERIDILASRPLGLRRALILARVRGRTILLGATPQQIAALAEWEEEAQPWGEEASAAGGAPAKPFDSVLAAFAGRESEKKR